MIEEVNENTKVVYGKMQLVELNELLGTKIPQDR